MIHPRTDMPDDDPMSGGGRRAERWTPSTASTDSHSLHDDDVRRADRVSFLKKATSAVALFALPFAFVAWPVMGAAEVALYTVVGSVMMAGTRTVVDWTGSVRSGAHWASMIMFVTIVVLIVLTGGDSSPVLPWIVAVPGFALAFASPRSGVAWACTITVVFALLYALPGISASTTRRFTEADRRLLEYLSASGATVIVAVLFVLYRQFAKSLEAVAADFEVKAHRDETTTLPNRRAFNRELHNHVRRSRRREESVVLAMLDLDDFKAINDQHGHAVGDELLVEVANRLENVLRSTDVVARLGGDEFGILLKGIDGLADLETAAERIDSVFDDPHEVEGRPIEFGCSFGFVVAEREHLHDQSLDEVIERLLNQADQAMYDSKKGDSRWSIKYAGS